MPGDRVRFLTPEWVAALHEAATASSALRDAASGLELVIENEIVPEACAGENGVSAVPTGGSEAVRYALVFANGDVAVRWGGTDDADVTFVQTRDAAEAMSRGELNAQRAFVLGKLRVRGDIDKLLEARDAFARFEDDVFGAVREQTTY